MKVVLDTNIFVSAFIVKNGNPSKILRLIEKFEVISCQAILDETKEVLHRKHIKKKYNLTYEEINEYISNLHNICSIVKPSSIKRVIKDDPDDDIILAIAKQKKANFIISGDPHLTNMNAYEGIKIMTPAKFLQMLTSK